MRSTRGYQVNDLKQMKSPQVVMILLIWRTLSEIIWLLMDITYTCVTNTCVGICHWFRFSPTRIGYTYSCLELSLASDTYFRQDILISSAQKSTTGVKQSVCYGTPLVNVYIRHKLRFYVWKKSNNNKWNQTYNRFLNATIICMHVCTPVLYLLQ